MKRRLFLTGPIGCGKSTVIGQALGDKLVQCGGFLTRRHREPYRYFTLESPDGTYKKTFLSFGAGKPEIALSAFSEIPLTGKVLVLDEIGGIELLNPAFTAALEAVLNSNVPILGVIKGESPAGALIDSLRLTEEYEQAAYRLRSRLKTDSDTLVYECGQYDEAAALLAKQWVEEYLHDEN